LAAISPGRVGQFTESSTKHAVKWKSGTAIILGNLPMVEALLTRLRRVRIQGASLRDPQG